MPQEFIHLARTAAAMRMNIPRWESIHRSSRCFVRILFGKTDLVWRLKNCRDMGTFCRLPFTFLHEFRDWEKSNWTVKSATFSSRSSAAFRTEANFRTVSVRLAGQFFFGVRTLPKWRGKRLAKGRRREDHRACNSISGPFFLSSPREGLCLLHLGFPVLKNLGSGRVISLFPRLCPLAYWWGEGALICRGHSFSSLLS